MLRADRPDRATAVAGRSGRARLAADEPWAALTDPDQLREILRAELPGGQAVERCEIFQTAFRTSPADRRAGRPVVALECRLEQGAALLHIRAYDGHGRRRFEQHRASALAYLPAADAVVWAFPADPPSSPPGPTGSPRRAHPAATRACAPSGRWRWTARR